MLARLSLATGLLACLALGDPAPVEASDRHSSVVIGVPSVEIYAPPLSIQLGSPPAYYPPPYYYYPPPPPAYYYPAPAYYPPRYYPHHHYRPYPRYYRDHYRHEHYRRRW